MIETVRLERPLIMGIGGFFMLLPMVMLFAFLPEMSKPEPGANPVPIIKAYVEQHQLEIIVNYLWTGFGELAIAVLLAAPDRPTVGEALGRALRLFPWYLLQRLLVFWIIMAGFMMLLLPGLYFAARLSLCTVLLGAGEGRNPVALIRRSLELTHRAGWHIVVFLVALWLGCNLFASAISAVSTALFAPFAASAVAKVAGGLLEGMASVPWLMLSVLFSVALLRALRKPA